MSFADHRTAAFGLLALRGMERGMPEARSAVHEVSARVTLAESHPALAPADGAPSEAEMPGNRELNRTDVPGNGELNRAGAPGNGEPKRPEALGSWAQRDVERSTGDTAPDQSEPHLEDLRRL